MTHRENAVIQTHKPSKLQVYARPSSRRFARSPINNKRQKSQMQYQMPTKCLPRPTVYVFNLCSVNLKPSLSKHTYLPLPPNHLPQQESPYGSPHIFLAAFSSLNIFFSALFSAFALAFASASLFDSCRLSACTRSSASIGFIGPRGW